MRRLERRAAFLQRSGNRFRDAIQYAPTKWFSPAEIRVERKRSRLICLIAFAKQDHSAGSDSRKVR